MPKKYIEKVGDDGFKKHPIGLGPYKFVSNTPGVELVMEAYEGYWRKMPHVKRLVYKSVPEATTRAVMLKNGEVDLAYLLDAPTALELKRDPNIKLAFSGAIGIHFLDFLDQWDPKSPWHDRRVRRRLTERPFSALHPRPPAAAPPRHCVATRVSRNSSA